MDKQSLDYLKTFALQDLVTAVSKCLTVGITESIMQANIDKVIAANKAAIKAPSMGDIMNHGRGGGH